ncbi:Hypothetical predicted protein [Pelobates cultripes]|uniref:Uncharacterized protein n=1 Tax=Pelobates cultripes TaxID=61616 RepID=A0AAD1RRM9_PELCU|nr:Hypothetical predicted protein [Pelobates cultripes]
MNFTKYKKITEEDPDRDIKEDLHQKKRKKEEQKDEEEKHRLDKEDSSGKRKKRSSGKNQLGECGEGSSCSIVEK